MTTTPGATVALRRAFSTKVFFHRGEGYDFGHALRAICALRAKPEHKDPSWWDSIRQKTLCLRKLRFNALARNSERMVTLRLGPLEFVD